MGVLALEGMPIPVSADFDISFMDIDGGRRCEPLSSCWMVPFERALPFRAFSSYKGKKSFSGLWWSATASEHVGYESWLERDRVMALRPSTRLRTVSCGLAAGPKICTGPLAVSPVP